MTHSDQCLASKNVIPASVPRASQGMRSAVPGRVAAGCLCICKLQVGELLATGACHLPGSALHPEPGNWERLRVRQGQSGEGRSMNFGVKTHLALNLSSRFPIYLTLSLNFSHLKNRKSHTSITGYDITY